MKYLDLSGLEHLIGRLIQWRSTDWTLNVNGSKVTVAAPAVADNNEFLSKIAEGDSVTLVFSNGEPTRRAHVISVYDRQIFLVGGAESKLIQYNLSAGSASIMLVRRNIANAVDLSSKLTASGTTEDLTVDTEGNLGLTYGDGFIERLCKDLGKTDVAKDALKDNPLLGSGLGLNPDLGATLATGNPKLGALLPTNSGFISSLVEKLVSDSSFGKRLATESDLGNSLASSSQFASSLASSSSFCNVLASCPTFISALATGELAKNNYFGTSLALYNSAFATALPLNSAFTTALALNSSFQEALANHPDFIGRFIYSNFLAGELASGTAFYPLLDNRGWINALKSALSR